MLQKLYLLLPSCIQNIALTIFGFVNDYRRYGRHYAAIESETKHRSIATRESIRELQRKRLSELFIHAKNSEFWKARFTQFNINTDSTDPFSELKKLPILTKKEVKSSADSIKINGPDVYKVHTSGTTGSGLVFYENNSAEAERWAVWWRYRFNLGITRKDWCALFGGRSIIAPNYKGSSFHRINYASKQVLFSCYHLSEGNVEHYIKAMNDKQLLWVHGYPSVLAELSSLALKRGLKLSYKVSWVTLGAENLSEHQARLIEQFFGVSPYQHYGLAESVANFSQRKNGNDLYVDEDFSLVEFVPLEQDKEVFRIIGTNLSNPAFPLFRYDTGDIANDVDESCFPRRVGCVDGRKEDYVVLPNGSKVGRLDHIFKDAIYVDEAQIVQKSDLSLHIKIVTNDKWLDTVHRKELENEFRQRLGSDICIRIEKVQSIVRTKSGKLRFVISEVK